MTFNRKHLRYLLPIPALAAAALIYFTEPAPKAKRKQAFFELTSATKETNRPVYPFSVVPGGIYDRTEAVQAIKLDRVVAKHYAEQGVNVNALRPVNNTKSKQGYVSYRVGDRIYWTKKKVDIEPGEVVLTDGVHKIRGRCGNMISDKPRSPVLNVEPPAKRMNEPDPSLRPSIDPSADVAPPAPVMPKLALERESGSSGAIHAYVASSGSGSGAGNGTGGDGLGSSGGIGSGGGSSGGGSGGGAARSSMGGGSGASGAGGGGASGLDSAGPGSLGGGSGSGDGDTSGKGAAYAIAAANTISGVDKFGADIRLQETASGANGGGWLSGMIASLVGTPNPNAANGGLASTQGGPVLAANGSGLGANGFSLAGGAADVKVLSASSGQSGTGGTKGAVHPFSADANTAAQLPPGNPSENMGKSTQLDTPGNGTSVPSANGSSGANTDTLGKRRENTRPDGALGTSANGDEPFSVRPTSEVPEPSTYLMVGAALTILAIKRRRS